MSYEKVIIVDEEGDTIINGKDEDYKGVMMRNAVKADLEATQIPTFSGREFKKTSYEKDLLKRCKTRWRSEMRALIAGWTPRTHKYTTLTV